MDELRLTDELRRFANEWDWLDYKADDSARKLRAIADRIDAEHERVTMNVMNDALYCANENDMAELGWIRLPVDADGKPWHLGDLTENGNVVEAMGFNRHGWYFVGIPNDIAPSIHRHYKPPTVEDVLEKALNEAAMLDRPEGYWPSAADITNIVNSLAAKLQLKENK